MTVSFKTLVPVLGALALVACQGEEATVEPAAEDSSGGELIATPADAEGVDVNLPETPMTNVPADASGKPTGEEPAADEGATDKGGTDK